MFLRRWRKLPATAAVIALGAAPAAAGPDPITADEPAQKGGYDLASTLAIGGADADDDAYFYEKFGGVEVDADAAGNIYVLDNGNTRIQVFDAKGRFLRSLGAEGEGPGEFQIPGKISVNAHGDVAVFDMGQARVSVLDSEGNLRWDAVVGNAKDLAFTSSGTLLVGYGKHGPAMVQAYGPDGKLAWEAGQLAPPGDHVVDIRLGRQQIAPRLAVIIGDGCLRTPAGEYLVQKFAATGAETAVFRRPFDRVAITAEDMAPPQDDDEEGGEPAVVMIKRTTGGPDGGGASGGGSQWSAQAGDEEEVTFAIDDVAKFLPEHHPDTRGVLAWPDGRVWILTAQDERSGVVTDEWSADGRWLRRFTVPEEYDWLDVGRDGKLYGVTHDEDDYPTVHRIDVRPEA
jgi:hypothetical protein